MKATNPSIVGRSANGAQRKRGTRRAACRTAVPRASDLQAGRIYALAVDPTTPATLYAGTYGVGVWQLDLDLIFKDGFEVSP